MQADSFGQKGKVQEHAGSPVRRLARGVYPMSADETVRLAVVDFDESAWRRDALLVARKMRAMTSDGAWRMPLRKSCRRRR